MAVIDEKGRLFGVVNVIDALVVLVVLAMVVAGIALVAGGDETEEPDPTPPEETRYATLSFDVPLESDGARLAANDTVTPRSGGDTLAVEDVYRSFSPDGDVHVVATVRYQGDLVDGGTVRYGGDTMELRTDAVAVEANVLAVNRTDATIPTRTERVVLVANVSTAAANGIETDTSARIGDTEVARISAVERLESANDHTRVAVGAEITVWDREPVAAFDGRPLRLGNRLTIVTDRVTVPGELAAIGTDDPDEVDG